MEQDREHVEESRKHGGRGIYGKVISLGLLWAVMTTVSFFCIQLPHRYLLLVTLAGGVTGILETVYAKKSYVLVPLSVLLTGIALGQFAAVRLQSYMEILTYVLLATSVTGLAVLASELIAWNQVSRKRRNVARGVLALAGVAYFSYIVLQPGYGCRDLLGCFRGGDGWVPGLMLMAMACLELISDLADLRIPLSGGTGCTCDWSRPFPIILDLVLIHLVTVFVACNVYV